MLVSSSKKLSHQLFQPWRRCYSSLSCNVTTKPTTPNPLLFSSTAASNENTTPMKTPFMAEYLINKCGFSKSQGIRASKHLDHVKSPAKPDAVINFLKRKGFGLADIRNLVLDHPIVLCIDVNKTLEPKIRSLEDAGFSGSDLVRLISTNACAFHIHDIAGRIDFWKKLLGSNELLLKATKHAHNLLGASPHEKIAPNIALLRSYGISDERIVRIVLRTPRFISAKADRIKSTVERVQKLGVSSGSGMFGVALHAFACLSETKFEEKLKLLKSFGWSEEEFASAAQKCPSVMSLSEKKITAMMGFLVNELGYEPSYIAVRPVILTLSLEKRLVPRYRVLRILKSKGLLLESEDGFFRAVMPSDEKFLGKYVEPYADEVPELRDDFVSPSSKRNVGDLSSSYPGILLFLNPSD